MLIPVSLGLLALPLLSFGSTARANMAALLFVAGVGVLSVALDSRGNAEDTFPTALEPTVEVPPPETQLGRMDEMHPQLKSRRTGKNVLAKRWLVAKTF